MRIKKSTTSLTGSEEDDIVLDSAKYHANIRIVQVELSTGEIEYLVTNILDPNITPEMLKKLYHKRWKIESKYYELKEHWELEQLWRSPLRKAAPSYLFSFRIFQNRYIICFSQLPYTSLSCLRS